MQNRQTTGTDLRPMHAVSGQGLVYSLDHERQGLRGDLDEAGAGRTAKTLVKSDTLRVTLVYAEAGTTLNPSAAAGGATIQVLDGRLTVDDAGNHIELVPGDLGIFSHNLRDPIRVIDNSTFLLTIAWEEGAGAWDEEAREAHH